MEINLDNKEFQYALELIQDTNQTFFLTGKAGTGKSTFLKHIIETVSKKFVVVAPTGIAAINVGGVTISSFFSFPLRPMLPQDEGIKTFSKHSEKRKLIEAMDTLIIDEISMVRADIIDGIDYSLRKNGGNPNLPFGGKQIIFIGDVFQLEPVARSDNGEKEFMNEIYGSSYFFKAKVFEEIQFFTIELLKVYRQTDQSFINLLDKVRKKEISETDLEKINNRFISDAELVTKEFVITLATTNALANHVNQFKLNELTTKLFSYVAEISGIFEETKYPTDIVLNLKIGAQVVFVKNDSEKRWANGTIGKIKDLTDENITIILEDGNIHIVEKVTWENIKFNYNRSIHKIESEVIGTFQQYPLKLAWAITIHKSQGLTFDKVIIDFGRGAFASGQTYVALSRATTINGVFLKRRVFTTDIIVHNDVKEFAKSYNDEKAIKDSIRIGKELLENKKLVKEIFSKNPRLFIDLICQFYSLNNDVFEKYNNHFNWGNWKNLSWNINLPWSLELIKKYEDKWHWNHLSVNGNIPRTIELIEKYKSKWHYLFWFNLSRSKNPPLSLELIERFEDELIWSRLSANENLPWSIELIEKYKDKWDWNILKRNKNIPCSLELFEKYKDRWNWNMLCENKKNIWSLDILIKYKDQLDWCALSSNQDLSWTLELIEKFKDRWNWNMLSENKKITWSLELLIKYKDQLDWSALSSNQNLPWSMELIEKNKDQLNWSSLSHNQNLPWTKELIKKFKDKWDWSDLSHIDNLIWSLELIDKYRDYWDWELLSQNKSIPWSLDLFEKYEDLWNKPLLSGNKKLPWSIELIEKFIEEWNWDSSLYGCNDLSSNESLPWSVIFINKFAKKWKSSKPIWQTLKPYINDDLIEEVFTDILKKSPNNLHI